MASPLALRKPPRLDADDDDDIVVDLSKLPPRIPDGIYKTVYARHNTHYMFRTGKLFIWFRIVEPGEQFGKELYAAYRVQLIGKTGRFKLNHGSSLFKMLCRVHGVKARPDRITLLWPQHCVLTVKTRTVERDYQQNALPEWMRYSVVDDVVRKESC